MDQYYFIVASIAGLVLVLIYLVAARLQLRAKGKLWKFVSVLTTMVGVSLIAVALATNSAGGAHFADVIRNSLLSTELTLRHWFQSLSLR